MTWITTLFVLGAAFLAVFWEAAFPGMRHLLGAQIDLLPSLVVYTALCARLTTLCLLSVLGGCWFDSLSANPLGVSILPLFAVGMVIHVKRDLILRDQTFARMVLGFAASGVAPLLSLGLLLSLGQVPLLGWGTVWQVLVMSVAGALATPVWFVLFDWLEHALVHARVPETSFRPDREIRRGR